MAITPAVGDLLVVYCFVAANTNSTPTCSDNNGSGTYDRIDVCDASISSINYRLSIFIRTALMVNTTSTTITVATGSNTAGVVHCIALSGCLRVGSDAVRSKGLQNNQAAAIPAPALSISALTGNLTIVACGSADTTTTPPTNWTEAQDTNFSNDTTALETATRASGFTGTTITFGAAQSTVFCSHALEIDGTGKLAGAAAMVFGSGSTSLTGAGALAGSAAMVFGAGSSTLRGTGALAASAAMTMGGAGTLEDNPGSSFPLAGWGKRKEIRYGALFPDGDQTDFPVPFEIVSDSDIAAELSGGGGVAFTLADGATLVPFGLDPASDLSAGTVIARAKFTSLSGASTGDVMGYLYYDGGQTTTEDKAGTVSNNFEALLGMGDDPSASAPQMFDWQTETYRGTAGGSMASGDVVDGVIGDALDFDGSNDEVSFSYGNGATITISACIRSPLTGLARDVMGYAYPQYAPGILIQSATDIRVYWGGSQAISAVGNLSADTWHHLAVTVEPGATTGHDIKLYQDGSLIGSASDYSPGSTPNGTNARFGGTLIAGVAFLGQMDECKVATVARSVDWINWEWKTELYNSGTFSLGPEETGGASGAITGTATLIFAAGSSTLTGAGALAGAAALTFAAGSSTLTGSGALAGSADLTLSGSGALAGTGALSGAAGLTLGASGSLLGSGALAGSAGLTLAATGTLVGAGALAGTASITFSGTATLSGAGALAGTAGLTLAGAGALTGAGALSGQAGLTLGASGLLDLPSGAMFGTAGLTLGGAATLAANGALAGAVAVTTGATGTLAGTGNLAGTVAVTMESAGELRGDGALTGNSALTFTGAGTLVNIGGGGTGSLLLLRRRKAAARR